MQPGGNPLQRTQTVPTTIAHPTLGAFTVGLRHRHPAGTPRHRALLLGGSGQSVETWREMETALTDAGCEVVAAAGRGIRPTDAPELPWTVADLAEDAVAILDHLEWTDPVTVVGFSLGGFTAEMLARSHPDRVSHAVLVAGHHRVSTVARAAHHTRRALAHDPAAAAAFDRYEALVTTLDADTLTQNETLAHTWWEVFDLRSRTWSDEHAAEGQNQAGAGWMTGTEPRPTMPTPAPRFSLVTFTGDLVIPTGVPARVAAAELDGGTGACRVVELPGGHGGLFTHPLESARAIVDLVTG